MPPRAQTREEGLALAEELVATFAEHLDYHKSPEFDETTNRQRFIDPFFAALGWDVADEDRRGPFADVVLEYSLRSKTGDPNQLTLETDEAEDQRVEDALAASAEVGYIGISRPDYSFRLGGERQFFVEAKRPSVEIGGARPVYQVKSYGWNAGTPVCVLTDFEELLVFDCRYPPVLEEPMTGLLTEFRMTFRDYPRNWDMLWDTFSREAVAEGSLTRYVATLVERRGLVPVDKAFLADLARWRLAIARDFATQNPELDVWELNDATQLTLDRLVFIRVCEDRRLEPTPVLRPLLDEETPYEEFIRAIVPLRENYNGGLLDPSFADALKLTPDTFKRAIRGLYTPWSPYRFDALGVEILGSIYERALGSVLTLDASDRSVGIEVKPEIRKSGGVYYTPQWVVDEIVRRTIDPLIEGKRPRDLHKFRVLDPACGSGSFLLGAFTRLIQHFERYYTEHPTVDRRLHFTDEQGFERLTAAAKASLLRNSIFGVDVDPAAVEVTTMSLYLKSLESDAPEYVRTQMSLSGAILPSLAENIRVGNSLVSTDFYAQTQLPELDEYEEHKLRPFKWDSTSEGFGRVLADGGFDVVIGNPPYFNVDSTYGAGHPIPAYLKIAFADVWLDKTDIYYYFLRRGAGLAKRRLAFIVSRALLEADKAKRIRGWLAETAHLDRLIDFDGFFVFPDAGIATAITIFDTTQRHGDGRTAVERLSSSVLSTREVVEGLRTESAPFEVFERDGDLGGRPWRFPNPHLRALFTKIDDVGEPLARLCELGQGMQTGANNVFGKLSSADIVKHELPNEYLKPRARNSDIQSFHISENDEFVLYLEDVGRYEDLPESVRTYLELPENREKLEGRAAYQRGDCEWWRFTWPLHQSLYSQPRLVSPYRTGHNRFALDSDFRWLTLTDTTVAFPRHEVDEDNRYLLGLLNSRLLTFRFRGLGKLTGPNMWEAFDNSIGQLPIRRIDFESVDDVALHDRVVVLAQQIEQSLVAKESGLSSADRSVAARRAEALIDQLDGIVLDLYGISDDEERTTILALGEPLD
jgi:Eco57I restriction-modification methylase